MIGLVYENRNYDIVVKQCIYQKRERFATSSVRLGVINMNFIPNEKFFESDSLVIYLSNIGTVLISVDYSYI